MLLFDVSGLKSDACCQKVQEAVSGLDPDAVVVIMRIAGRAAIDTTLSAEEAAQAIESAGYRATLAPAA